MLVASDYFVDEPDVVSTSAGVVGAGVDCSAVRPTPTALPRSLKNPRGKEAAPPTMPVTALARPLPSPERNAVGNPMTPLSISWIELPVERPAPAAGAWRLTIGAATAVETRSAMKEDVYLMMMMG